MKQIILFILLLGSSNAALAALSAARPESEDYRVKATQTLVFNSPTTSHFSTFDNAVSPFADSTVAVPEFLSVENMQTAFSSVRDRKNLHWLKMPESPRRNTYLYPIDGCFMRAALMNKNLKANRIKPLPKIYVFGNLNIKTRYTKSGTAAWYFHVALIARVGKDEYVFDPSMDYDKPMRMDSWLGAMGVNRTNSELRICDADNYSPYEPCVGGHGFYEEIYLSSDVEQYLSAEWYNLINIGLDPQKLLGENPPWEK